ncbi:MAG TPA: rhodanese-like domain-containing protein [Dongiaceae bacterium]|nr:rhodanese-like domain-containing protein [Dongiaceae bacterium]
MSGYETVSQDEAAALVAAGEALVLDVRNPDEWAQLGTIPGAVPLPMDLALSATATLPRDGRAVLVCCEHGVRSAAVARMLAAAGLPRVLNLAGGMSAWRGDRAFEARVPDPRYGPSSWLLANVDLLPSADRAGGAPEVLDVASGSGRHALLLASAGFKVRAIDADETRLAGLRATAAAVGLGLEAARVDLESAGADLGSGEYDLILVFRYLHRPLFPALAKALRPGGVLLYETYTEAQAGRGKPTSPAHLLEAGELRRLVQPLRVLREREGEYDGAMVAGVVARREG